MGANTSLSLGGYTPEGFLKKGSKEKLYTELTPTLPSVYNLEGRANLTLALGRLNSASMFLTSKDSDVRDAISIARANQDPFLKDHVCSSLSKSANFLSEAKKDAAMARKYATEIGAMELELAAGKRDVACPAEEEVKAPVAAVEKKPPDKATHPSAEAVPAPVAKPVSREETIIPKEGDTLDEILEKMGLLKPARLQVIACFEKEYGPVEKSVRAGEPLKGLQACIDSVAASKK